MEQQTVCEQSVRVTSQAASSRILVAESRVRYQGSPLGFLVDKVVLGHNFKVFLFPFVNIIMRLHVLIRVSSEDKQWAR